MIFQACLGSFPDGRCEQQMGFDYCCFLSVSVDPGSSTWMAALAVTWGSFDRRAVEGKGEG